MNKHILPYFEKLIIKFRYFKLFFKVKILLLIIIGLSTQANNATAQSSGGGFAETYILRNSGSRSIGMAGAYTAIVNEPNAVFFNPAGLGFLSNTPILAATVSSLDYGNSHSTLAWGQSVSDHIGVGVGINTFSSPSFTARNFKGQEIGTFNDFQYSMNFSAAYKQETVAIGATMKYLKNNLAGSGYYGDGFAFDLGTKFNVLNTFSFGMAVQNISGMMFWNSNKLTRDNIPWVVRTGVAMEFGVNDETYTTRTGTSGDLETIYIPATRYLLVSMDAVMTQFEKSPSFVVGFEAAVHEMIAFRAGIDIYGEKDGVSKLFPMNKIAGGVSLRPNLENMPFKTHVDYSICNEYLSNSRLAHNISFVFEF